jgi:hypothetical protein
VPERTVSRQKYLRASSPPFLLFRSPVPFSPSWFLSTTSRGHCARSQSPQSALPAIFRFPPSTASARCLIQIPLSPSCSSYASITWNEYHSPIYMRAPAIHLTTTVLGCIFAAFFATASVLSFSHSRPQPLARSLHFHTPFLFPRPDPPFVPLLPRLLAVLPFNTPPSNIFGFFSSSVPFYMLG